MRIGFLCHQASVNQKLLHASALILDKSLKLKVSCFLGPQHGIRGEKQDNMVESTDSTESRSKLPVYSLYGEFRQPTQKTLDQVDVFIVDLQDIGCRIYTYMNTLLYCLQAAKANGKKVLVLDRPNPIGGTQVEGNLLDLNFTSFVGLFPMCTRHGMTMGELALMFNEEFGIGADLEVIPLQGWKREMYAEHWGRDWVLPSPNMPSLQTALVFPGMVHFEGTLISEGRGTTKPFEQIGAPYIDADALAITMNKLKLPGVYFRPVYFQPTFQKSADQVCGGVYTHVLNRKQFNAFETGITLLSKIAEFYPHEFVWKHPPYEYETEKMPIDCITGTEKLRIAIESHDSIKKFLNQAKIDVVAFKKKRAKFLLY
jgi:uncharacterized protein YbbC (DUF1343 family)